MNDKTKKRIKRALLCLLLLLFGTAIIWAVVSNRTSNPGTVATANRTPDPSPEEVRTPKSREPEPEPDPDPEYRTPYRPRKTYSTPPFTQHAKNRCALTAPSLEEIQVIERNIKAIRESFPTMRAAGTVTIPVYFHILTSADRNEGDLTNEDVAAQINVLNTAFAGNGPGGTGHPTPFKFELKEIDRTADDTWFNMVFLDDPTQAELAAKARLNKGDQSALNIYTVKLTSKPFGWARWPWDFADGADGIVIGYTTLPGGSLLNFNQGDTATHEVGHWLGLFHTYEGNGCNPPGDYVADTAAELSGAIGCPNARNTCWGGGSDPIRNFMDSTNDTCICKFSAGQADRMDAIHLQYRPAS